MAKHDGVKREKHQDVEKFQDEVRKRAEEIYNERQKLGIVGDALGDWLKAEKDLWDKHGIK